MADGDPVLLFGIPSEPPLAMAAAELARLGVPHLMLNQRRCEEAHAFCCVEGEAVAGMLAIDGQRIALEAFGGIYNRAMAPSLLPGVRDLAEDDPLHLHATRLHEVVEGWCQVAPGRVVNRARAMGSNGSKPYQAQLIEPWFDVPATLITNEPDEVLAFRDEYERVVYKSISGVRSIVQELTDDDLLRLPSLATCPAQFQQFVPGQDVRVHTFADGSVFATAVHSDATDYRYSDREGAGAKLTAVRLEDEVAERCLGLAAALGLDFAGLDLRFAPDGSVFCFEVNPAPAYSYYEEGAGQPIARALARYLAGASS